MLSPLNGIGIKGGAKAQFPPRAIERLAQTMIDASSNKVRITNELQCAHTGDHVRLQVVGWVKTQPTELKESSLAGGQCPPYS